MGDKIIRWWKILVLVFVHYNKGNDLFEIKIKQECDVMNTVRKLFSLAPLFCCESGWLHVQIYISEEFVTYFYRNENISVENLKITNSKTGLSVKKCFCENSLSYCRRYKIGA